MKISKSLDSLRHTVKQWRNDGLSIGFVPTMGNLHAGHMALVELAGEQCDKVVVSIFVNPLQFNEVHDFEAYPITLEADQQKLMTLETDLLFLPDSELMYPQGQAIMSKVRVPEIGDTLEGASRPGHFEGVATVVNKLFNQVQPDRAFFGEKDFQQVLLIRKMVQDFNLPIEIQTLPTQREADGLAMSSRNSRLSASQRVIAAELYRVLVEAREQLRAGLIDIQQVEQQALQSLKTAGFEPEYVSARDISSLLPAKHGQKGQVLLAAARLGDVRLIDNLLIDQ